MGSEAEGRVEMECQMREAFYINMALDYQRSQEAKRPEGDRSYRFERMKGIKGVGEVE